MAIGKVVFIPAFDIQIKTHGVKQLVIPGNIKLISGRLGLIPAI